MWTPSALASELHPARGVAWRAVEDQNSSTSRRLTDSLAEQEVLEEILEEGKPAVPEDCARLHYLLQTPFRYAPPAPRGSRFRSPGDGRGVFYASAHVAAALAEMAFSRTVFFDASAGGLTPRNVAVLTVFSVAYRTRACLDLTAPPLERDAAAWSDAADYGSTQALADAAREAGCEVIRYRSVRDPEGHRNVALLDAAAFASRGPDTQQTWRLWLGPDGADARRAVGEGPPLVFPRDRLLGGTGPGG